MEEHMLIIMDKSTHEANISHTLRTIKKQFKKTFTFLTGYISHFNITNKKRTFFHSSY